MGLKQLVILSLIAYHLSLIVGCGKEENIKTETRMIKSEPEQILKNFTVFESKEGKKIWHLVAKEGYIFGTENKVIVRNFTVKFFTEDGKKVKAKLSAQEGEIDRVLNNFYTKGKTIVKSADGEILECNDLYYSSEKKKIYSESSIKLTRRDSIIRGKGIEATPDLSSVVIKENVVEIRK